MKKDDFFLHFLIESIHDLRNAAGLSVKQLCEDAHVSTRTFAKLSKKERVKDECYVRLVAGSCKGATFEEFMGFWMKLGIWIYERYC